MFGFDRWRSCFREGGSRWASWREDLRPIKSESTRCRRTCTTARIEFRELSKSNRAIEVVLTDDVMVPEAA
jgi:hypothetical protein